MYQRKRNWYMVWRQCKCNIDWTVLHNSRLCIKRKFHRNRCMRLAVAYCYPKNLRASGIRTRVVEVKYDIKISVRKICNWASFSVICWIRIEMCNDTEASLEADWEGYKSIWLSLNSPLWLTPNYNPVNIIRLGYIRSIWLICTSCNSSIRCRTSRAAPFARSRCNCKEHVCKWYW